MDYNGYNDDWADVIKKSRDNAQAAAAAQKEQCVGSKDVDKQIKGAINRLVGGAPADADTLKELDDKIKEIDAGTNGYSKNESDARYQPKGEYATKSDISSVENKIPDTAEFAKKTDIPVVPTKVSQLENDKNYLTEHQDLSDYAKKADVPTVPSKVSELTNDSQFVTETFVNEKISALIDGAPEELNTLKEISDKLKDDSDAVSVLTSQISGKADTDKVYSKTEADATFIKEHQSLDDYAKKTEVSGLATKSEVEAVENKIPDVTGFALKSELPVVPTKVSAFENDANYLTEHQSLDDYAKKTELSGLATKEELQTVENKIPTKVSELENDSNYLTEHQDLSDYAKIVDVSTSLEEKANTAEVVSKADYDALMARFNYLEKYMNDYLALTQQQLEEKNDEIINNLSPDKKTVDIITPMESIVVPDAQNTAYTINVPLQNNATVELTSNKYAYLNNTSEEPVDVAFTRTISQEESETASNPTLYITGSYGSITLENISVSQKDTDENEVDNVIITENNTKSVSLTASLKDGAVITNNSNCAVTINNKNSAGSDAIVVAPNSTVTLQSGTFNELSSTVGESTLYINKAHIKKLIVNKGNVVVNDYSVESHIDEIVNDTEYTVTPRTYSVTTAADLKKAASTPALYNLENDITDVASIATGLFGSSAKINMNGHKIVSTGSNGAFFLRGTSHFIIENGTIDAKSYGIWMSGNGKVELKDVNIIADTHALYIEKTGAEVYTTGNCRFSVKGDDKRYVANYLDSVYSGGWTHGFHFGAGTKFVDFNPAASIGEPGGPVNLLDDGFTTVLAKEIIEGVEHDIYTVVAE